MSTCLVTGVTGQDGGYLAERLLAEGHEVHGTVRAGDDQVEALRARSPGVVLHEADLTDPPRLAEVVREVAPDELYHLAGVSSVARSWEEPLRTAQVVALGGAALLDAARALGDRVRCVCAASAEVFGHPEVAPQDERTPVRPTSPYGAAKAYVHHLAEVHRREGRHVSSLVLYSHESPRRPEHFVSRRASRKAALVALGRADEVVLGNLEARRDWGWAPDYVDAMVRAARHPEAGDYVVASGTARSVRELAEAALRAAGAQAPVRSDPALLRPADAPLLVGDAARAREVLGWAPTVGFDELVARMVAADLADLGRDRSGPGHTPVT